MEIKRTPTAGEALLKSGNILIWREMKINRIRKKYHSRMTGLINATWKSRKGGRVLALCTALQYTHIHARPLPVAASPLLPSDPTTADWGPLYPHFVRVLLFEA